ncbi:SDR family oxidoreductase [Acaryochloris sp. IP29b_bin.148]|uniref:SDR family NAD(P)-dependent oxidoreductase n=1 Tax=Acaryochloris sp. IP29b_bin.148 TaxID=2969218 RepID=UPI002625701E|nr:SDR family oxidoreductase [Acaryochloris sp. IP29b_bin.148]
MPTYLLIGASRGIGGSTAQYLVSKGAEILGVSRSPAIAGTWIEADIGTDQGIDRIAEAVGDRTLDGLLFLGGAWEKGAFTEEYDFVSSPKDEVRSLISVNLIAPILLARALAQNLAKAENPRIILNGALSGLPNAATPEVANTATKFGMQGVAQSLNMSLRAYGIGTTVVNPGNVATPEVMEDIAEGRFGNQVPIPIEDILHTYEYILHLSASTVPVEINLAQKKPG